MSSRNWPSCSPRWRSPRSSTRCAARIQAAIDRRFYRKKYDAQQVLAQFAITARDETDMNVLTAELARVVQETMAPTGITVWLNPPMPPAISRRLFQEIDMDAARYDYRGMIAEYWDVLRGDTSKWSAAPTFSN